MFQFSRRAVYNDLGGVEGLMAEQNEVAAFLKHKGVARVIAKAPALLYGFGLGRLMQGRLLLLSTRGRRSGKRRKTALGYQRVEGTVYVLSEAGTHADWWRNIEEDPEVRAQIGGRRFAARAERVTDENIALRVMRGFSRQSARVAEKFYGIPERASDEDLRLLAERRLIVALREDV